MDCNTNGSPDDLDIFRAVSFDCNANRVPDECEGSQPDLDCDGDVDCGDFAAFRACHAPLGHSVPPGCEAADLDRDGDVDCADWRILRDSWTAGTPPNYFRCRAPSAVTPVEE